MASHLVRTRGLMIAVLMTLLPLAAEAVTVPQWQDVPPVCLPSRVSKDPKIDGCVCPPQSLCPSVAGIANMQDLINNSEMPPALTMACCTLPVCPAGTDLEGQALPADGECNKKCSEGPNTGKYLKDLAAMTPPQTCTVPSNCRPGYAWGTYNGPYQHFTYGAVAGPAVGSVNYTGCLPVCRQGDNLFAEDERGFGWLHTAWIHENVPYTETPATDGTPVWIACRYVAMTNDCVRSDSLVTLADGSTKAIASIAVGDHLKGPDGDVEVLSVNRQESKTLYYRINDFKFAITGDHPIQTTKGWKSADMSMKYKDVVVGRLEVGDTLVTSNGEVQVKSITVEKPKKGTSSVNISTAGDRTFFVDGVAIKPFKDVNVQY